MNIILIVNNILLNIFKNEWWLVLRFILFNLSRYNQVPTCALF